jgi:ribosomal protein S4
MKKHRILKEWLKEVDHWFKDPWLSLLVDPTRRGKRVPGEIRAREQQDGEVVTGGENIGYTAEEKALRVKAAHQAIAGALAVVKKDLEHTKRHADRAPTSKKVKILMRLKRSRQVLRKPRPSMWLANLQCKRWVAEKAAWIAKPKKDKQAHLLARKKLSIESVKSGKGPLGPKAAPLKIPADHFIPRVIWKDIHRRVRRLTWRESDDAFTRRGFRNAFKFYPAERNRAPWLEALMYNRSLYSTNLREFRRHQFPREQKKYKWLQRVRKGLFPGRTHVYIKGRRWPRLRTYNQRLHYSLFNLPDRNSARRHFKKLSRRSRTVGFVRSQEGLSNRLDNVLVHLNMAPTIFWARHVATRGLLRVNGKIAHGADYQLKAGDFIEPVWDKVIKYRHFFKNPLQRREEKFRHHRWSPTGVPRNFEYHPAVRCYTFLGNPREEDLRRSSRLQPHLFRWFRLDSGAKKSIT